MGDAAVRLVGSLALLHASSVTASSAVFRVSHSTFAVHWAAPNLLDVVRRVEALRMAVQATATGISVTLTTTVLLPGEPHDVLLRRLYALQQAEHSSLTEGIFLDPSTQ
ncbi:hypothetical protein [Deinococcus multiflagellatus]|uniref:Secreted protein n=2 Tax=Deinococcus multiflagellatus TaxID=1656887 RepID=A0ABW1ZLU0_9DEIO